MTQNHTECKRKELWLDFVCIAAAFAAVVLFFGAYTRDLQQTDTYAKWFYTIKTYGDQYRINARLGEWAYISFFYRLIGEPQHCRAFHVSLGILLHTLIVWLLWRIVCGCCRLERSVSRLCALLPVLLLRVNVFYSDIFQYGVDAPVMFIGDLLAVAGAMAVTGTYMKKSFPAGVILLAVSLLFRQTCLFWFLLTGLFIVFCESADGSAKPFIKDAAVMAGAVFLAVLPMLLLINFWSPAGARGSFEQVDLSETWRAFREKLYLLTLNCDGIQPEGFYPAVTAGAFLLNVPAWASIRRERGTKALFSVLAREITVLMGVFAGTFFTLLFDVNLPHRSSFGFAAFLPLLVLFPARFHVYESAKVGRFLRLAAMALLTADLAVNGLYTVRICNGLAETNRIDQENARFYYRMILNYEKETGKRIEMIAWHYDQNYTWTLPGIIGAGNINNRAYSFPWSRREILHFTVDRYFTVIPFDDDLYKELFGDRDWDEISEEQVRFKDDTAYIALY